ncbi:MAG: DUF2066 domain-containing protein [Gammaproteobacteria bacterium]|nr:DUF2066 domain-containing protein [Gammaproteobacteria bacterium]MBL6998774.1 DUF2066 domain-containing protein [Gammaproteobacteria bacterium]
MKRSLIGTVLVFLMLQSAGVRAALVEDLFTVELAVADQSTSLRLEVFNQALRDVIIKVSGTAQSIEHPGLSQPLRSSSRYVHQFRYLTRKKAAENSFDSGQLYLRVAFNQEAIENLLRENDIPVWGKERPGTLFLLSYELEGRASVVSSDTTPELLEEIEGLALHQGLPVLFPLLDLEDRTRFSVQDITGFNEQNLTLAAARYAPDALLAGQIYQRGGEGWTGQWQVYYSNQVFKWTFRGESHLEVLSQAIAQLAQALAKEYALASFATSNEEILFNVDKINQLKQHVKVLAYLQSLDPVETVRLVLIDQDRATYRVKLRNSTADLSRLIALSTVLEQLELPQIDAATENQAVIMNYRFIQ